MSAPRKSFDGSARTRLAKLLGILGSVHDGEVLNAARAADRLVRSFNMTWVDVIGSAPRIKRQTNTRRKSSASKASQKQQLTWEQIAQQVLASDRVTPWERSFCENLLRHWRGRRLSEKQATVLTTIWCERAREAA